MTLSSLRIEKREKILFPLFLIEQQDDLATIIVINREETRMWEWECGSPSRERERHWMCERNSIFRTLLTFFVGESWKVVWRIWILIPIRCNNENWMWDCKKGWGRKVFPLSLFLFWERERERNERVTFTMRKGGGEKILKRTTEWSSSSWTLKNTCSFSNGDDPMILCVLSSFLPPFSCSPPFRTLSFRTLSLFLSHLKLVQRPRDKF